jgi:hypothetical protein
VNPYNPDQIFVLTDKGIQISADGGFSFKVDDVLTALLTASGKYALIPNFAINLTNTPFANRENALGTMSYAASHRYDPAEVVVASPFTGLFYTNGDGKWRSLSETLPRPRTSISAVGIDCEAIYAATEGRSIVRVVNYRNAPLASWFQPAQRSSPGGVFVTLYDSAKASVPNAAIDLVVTDSEGIDVFAGSVQTDAKGEASLPDQVRKGAYVAHLRFNGNAAAGATETSFTMSF